MGKMAGNKVTYTYAESVEIAYTEKQNFRELLRFKQFKGFRTRANLSFLQYFLKRVLPFLFLIIGWQNHFFIPSIIYFQINNVKYICSQYIRGKENVLSMPDYFEIRRILEKDVGDNLGKYYREITFS